MQKLIIALAVAFFAFILWIIYLANTGGHSPFFDFIRTQPNGDKWGHFALFGTLNFVVVLATRYRSLSLGKFRIYQGTLGVLIFVISEEISQVFIATRTFDLVDLSADFLGISLSALAAFAIPKKPSTT